MMRSSVQNQKSIWNSNQHDPEMIQPLVPAGFYAIHHTNPMSRICSAITSLSSGLIIQLLPKMGYEKIPGCR